MNGSDINRMISGLKFIELDLINSDYKEYPHRLKKLINFVNNQSYIATILNVETQFNEWLNDCQSNVGSFVGSGTLLWPENDLLEMIYKWNIILISAHNDDTLWLTHDFYYSGKYMIDHKNSFHKNITDPFIKRLKAIIESFENIKDSKYPESYFPDNLSHDIYDKLKWAVFHGTVYIGNNSVNNVSPTINADGNQVAISVAGETATSNQTITNNDQRIVTNEEIIENVNEINSAITKNFRLIEPEVFAKYKSDVRPTLDVIAEFDFGGKTIYEAENEIRGLITTKSDKEKTNITDFFKSLPSSILQGVSGNLVYDVLKSIFFSATLLAKNFIAQ